jgi:hypothetical protein
MRLCQCQHIVLYFDMMMMHDETIERTAIMQSASYFALQQHNRASSSAPDPVPNNVNAAGTA